MKNLKIYFTTDIHSYIFPTDYTSKDLKNIGLLNILSNIEKDENTLLIDGGDTLEGSPLSTYLLNNSSVKFISDIFNYGKYDFITLGNHDFNYGFSHLKTFLENLDATCLCANISDKTKTLPIEKFSIKELPNGLKVGIIGLSTDFIPILEKPSNIKNFTFLDSFEECRKLHDFLKPKVDILICLYHGGFECDLDTHECLSLSKENIGFKICKELSFDLLLSGHQHLNIFNKNLFNTHIVQCKNKGSNYIEVSITKNLDKTTISSKLKTPKLDLNSPLLKKFQSTLDNVQSWLDIPIGFLDTPLYTDTHLNMALNGSLLANFINSVQLDVFKADISCTSFGNSIKGFNKNVTIRDVVSTYIYPNTLVVLEITGSILKKALIRCSEYFKVSPFKPIEVSDSFLKPKVAHYNYDFFSNIYYTFDLKETGFKRLKSVIFNGKEVSDTDTFSLIMNNYRATGIGGYDFFKDCPIIKEIQVEMPNLIIDYFLKYKNISISKEKFIKIEQ